MAAVNRSRHSRTNCALILPVLLSFVASTTFCDCFIPSFECHSINPRAVDHNHRYRCPITTSASSCDDEIDGTIPNDDTTTTSSTAVTMSTTAAASSVGLRFGSFLLDAAQIFYRSPSGLTAGVVNLKPIVPGHVLILPVRSGVARLHQLTSAEYDDLFRTVRTVQAGLERWHGAGGSNVAVQDGAVAGQSVPHVHVHVLPRVPDDFARNDDVYDALDTWSPPPPTTKLEVARDEDRPPRTLEEMAAEAETYRTLFLQ